MRTILPVAAAALAALAVPAAPAAAQFADRGFSAGAEIQLRDGDGRRHHAERHHHRGSRDTVVVGGWGWNEGWALYNNRTFQSDSYNDWWHDRPDRAYPRWISTNRGCERVWWSGSGWRC